MSASDLAVVTNSIDDIDCSDNLNVFEAFQKVFVVNGTNLKVLDFKNCELTHIALATAHANGDILTQATSNAVMVVDFTNTAKTKTYGYVTSGTFNATNAVTGSGSGTGFTPTATDTGIPGGGEPLWYDWTVYPGGASGAMPEKAYLGCLYRGRCVLSGNPNYPYQWYMARVANPWDWAYTANDALSPVAGGNARAGELGDVIRALIPYQDEYLLFGCANSIWALRGDAADGGSLTPLNETTGIFGAHSWCFDGAMNLFFVSKNGIHKIPYGFGPTENLSQFVLPNLVEDTTLDPTVHRVLVEYDRENEGILITITTIDTGANVAYWYDLKPTGFYPESYPNVCGVYSAHFYASNDDSTRKLLLGCTDGYVRTFDSDTTNDTTTNGTDAISSNMTLPIIEVEDDDNNLRMNVITVTTAGGDAGGSDSNGVTVDIHTDDEAEGVLESIEDGDTPLHTVTLTGPGKANQIRKKARGKAIGIRLSNTTASETWAVEKVSANIKEV